MRHHEIDSVFKGPLFRRAVMRPESHKSGLPINQIKKCEEVLQAVVVERITFDIKVQVTKGGLGQTLQTSIREHGQNLSTIFSGITFCNLEGSLRPQTLKSFHLDPWNRNTCGELRKRPHRWNGRR